VNLVRLGIVVAVLLVAVASAVVVVHMGSRHSPSFPSLADAPDRSVAGWLVIERRSADLLIRGRRRPGG
jgi:hypothetical protein